MTKPNSSSKELVETVDIFPTLTELAGLPEPPGPQPIDGKSLVPVLEDPNATVDDHAYHCFPKGGRLGRAIRTERYRLVEWRPQKNENASPIYELYDYEKDPLETVNIADTNTTVLEELKAILARHPRAKAAKR